MNSRKKSSNVKVPYGDEDFYRWSKKPTEPNNARWYQTVVEKSKAFSMPVKGFSFLITVINFSKRNYFYVGESATAVTGYSSRKFFKGGLNFAMGMVFEEDHERMKQMHMDILEWHFSKPLKHRTEYRYSQQFRIVRKDGKVIWFETHDFFVELDQEGKPLVCFQLCVDVTHLKKDENQSLKISKVLKSGEQKLMKEFVYRKERKSVFTTRETEILKLLAKGLGSKQIAKKLGIDSTTVSKHRQNMLRKTNLLNTGSLVNYAWNNHLLT